MYESDRLPGQMSNVLMMQMLKCLVLPDDLQQQVFTSVAMLREEPLQLHGTA
jgi:hypothetical protein